MSKKHRLVTCANCRQRLPLEDMKIGRVAGILAWLCADCSSR